MLIALVSDPSLDGAAKLVEAAGKGNLAFASFLVLVLAALAWKFFGKDAQWVRIAAFLVIIACIVFFVYVLAVPTTSKQIATGDQPIPNNEPKPEPSVKAEPAKKRCTGSKTLTFVPKDRGVMQTNPDGSRVNMGDGGGGTTLEKWAYSWKAPAAVTSLSCAGGRNEHVLAQNKDGSNAQCVGSINGGDDAMTMTVAWDGPCDQQ